MGGGAQSDVWCQVMADVLGCTVRQPEAPIQANALGAAFIGAVGIGALRFDDLPDLQRTQRIYEPNRAHRAAYEDSYATFQEVHRCLAPLYRKINPARKSAT